MALKRVRSVRARRGAAAARFGRRRGVGGRGEGCAVRMFLEKGGVGGLYGYLVRSLNFNFSGNSGFSIGVERKVHFLQGSTATKGGGCNVTFESKRASPIQVPQVQAGSGWEKVLFEV